MNLLVTAVKTDQLLQNYKNRPWKWVLLIGLAFTPLIGPAFWTLMWAKSYKLLHVKRSEGKKWASFVLNAFEVILWLIVLLGCQIIAVAFYRDPDTPQSLVPMFKAVPVVIILAWLARIVHKCAQADARSRQGTIRLRLPE